MNARIAKALAPLIVFGAIAGLVPAGASAQEAYPNRVVRLVQGYAPGGPVDIVSRILADKLAEMWGKPVIVESKVGAVGSVAAREVARAAPDGHTLLVAASNHVQTPFLRNNLGYDALKDFTPIRLYADVPMILVVNPKLPVKNMAEFVAYSKKNKPSMATSGVGSAPHLAAAQLATRSGSDFLYVPFNGVAPGMVAVIGGDVNGMFLAPPLAVPAVQDGKLRAIASSGSRRWRDLPALPTVGEAGYPKYEASVWIGVLGPAKMPSDLVARIDRDIRTAVQDTRVKARLAVAGYETLDSGAAQFDQVLKDDYTKWGNLISSLKIERE